jgi:prevent-host-death family protein
MEQVPIRTLNQHTADVIGRVRRGEVVEVTSRGRPVARIIPIAASDAAARLVADGVALPPTITGLVPMPAIPAAPGPEAGELVSRLRDEERW